MWPLQGRSTIMDCDEILPILRESVAYRAGKPEKSPGLRFASRANVQPLTGKALALLPEGDRQKEQFMVYAPLDVGVPKIRSGDKCLRNGGLYIFQEAKDWGSYVEARMVRQDVPAGSAVDFGALPTGAGHAPMSPPETAKTL